MIKGLLGVALISIGCAGCAMEVGNAEVENSDSTEQALSAGGSNAQPPVATAQDQLAAATKAMQETQMNFNLQNLQLQSQMQNENRSFSAVSNIMKTKNDTVKNSISNIH